MSQTPSIDDVTVDQFLTVVRRFFRECLHRDVSPFRIYEDASQNRQVVIAKELRRRAVAS